VVVNPLIATQCTEQSNKEQAQETSQREKRDVRSLGKEYEFCTVMQGLLYISANVETQDTIENRTHRWRRWRTVEEDAIDLTEIGDLEEL
jgi:hypothetical protein